MSRGLSGVLKTAYDGDHIVSIVLVKLEFNPLYSGSQFYHSGMGDLDYLGDTYTGVGDFGRIEPIQEDKGIKMKGITIALQGVDTLAVDITSSEPIQGRPATVYLAIYDYDTALILDAFEIFSGKMDTMELTRGTSASLVLTVESIMSQFDLPNIRRFTSEDHKQRYPTDLFFDLMVQSNERQITWGANATGNNAVGGGSTGDGPASGNGRYKDKF